MTTQDKTILDLRKAADDKFAQAAARKTLQEKRDQSLLVPYRGGLFKAGPVLISFLSSWQRDDLVIPDAYEQPVRIDRSELLMLLKSSYQTAMNSWAQEYGELAQVRRARDA